MTQPDHQADPSLREEWADEFEHAVAMALYDMHNAQCAGDLANDGMLVTEARYLADKLRATTRTSPQLSEGMVGQERIEDVIAQALTYEISDTAYLNRLSRKAAKAVISALNE